MTPDGRTLLGVLTPSSNTRLEPVTSAIVAGMPGVSAHFGRFRVTEVGLGAASQFDPGPVVDAAGLLADARVDAITWSGTSGGWRGIGADRELCAAITDAVGVPATTSTLALLEAVQRLGATRLGLVSPYPEEMHGAIVATLERAGLDVVASEHDGFTTSNWELSTLPTERLTTMVASAASDRPEVITTFCTNLVAPSHAAQWEAAYGVTVLDSITLAVWHGLELAGYDGPWPTGWGRFFA